MFKFHPVTEIFPLMQGEQYDQLVQDIRENDLQEPIWLHPDERIIDGRNRYRACLDAGVEPRFRTWNGEGSLIQFVVSLNLHRRHLTSSQRAAAAAEALEQLKVEAKERQREGGRTKLPQKIVEAPGTAREPTESEKAVSRKANHGSRKEEGGVGRRRRTDQRLVPGLAKRIRRAQYLGHDGDRVEKAGASCAKQEGIGLHTIDN